MIGTDNLLNLDKFKEETVKYLDAVGLPATSNVYVVSPENEGKTANVATYTPDFTSQSIFSNASGDHAAICAKFGQLVDSLSAVPQAEEAAE